VVKVVGLGVRWRRFVFCRVSREFSSLDSSNKLGRKGVERSGMTNERRYGWRAWVCF